MKRDLRLLSKGEIGYTMKKDKYVFCKDGVYFSLTAEQVRKMELLCDEILSNPKLSPAT